MTAVKLNWLFKRRNVVGNLIELPFNIVIIVFNLVNKEKVRKQKGKYKHYFSLSWAFITQRSAGKEIKGRELVSSSERKKGRKEEALTPTR